MAKIEIKQNLVKGRSRKKKVVDSSAVDDDIMAMLEMQEENENKIEKKTKRIQISTLDQACRIGDLQVVIKYLNIFNLNRISESGGHPLFGASYGNHIHIVKYLLDQKHILINRGSVYGDTALSIAADQGHLEVTKLLLESGADPNLSHNKSKTTPLMYACGSDRVSCIKELLKHSDTEINVIDDSKSTALMYACHRGNRASVHQLLKRKDIDLDLVNDEGYTASSMCCRLNEMHILKDLIDAGANINQSSSATNLFIAIQLGHLEIVDLLLSNVNINVNLANKNNEGATPLFIATEKGYFNIVERLIILGADVNKVRANDNAPPLTIACDKNWTEITMLLLSAGADVNIYQRSGYSPLMAAIKSENLKITQKLLKKGANYFTDDNLEHGVVSPFTFALKNNKINFVNVLLQSGVDVNEEIAYHSLIVLEELSEQNKYKWKNDRNCQEVRRKCLHAFWRESEGSAKSGMCLSATPIWFASLWGFAEMVQLFLRNGATMYSREKKTLISAAEIAAARHNDVIFGINTE